MYCCCSIDSIVDCDGFNDTWFRLFCSLGLQVVLSQWSTEVIYMSTHWTGTCCTFKWVCMQWYGLQPIRTRPPRSSHTQEQRSKSHFCLQSTLVELLSYTSAPRLATHQTTYTIRMHISSCNMY